MTPPTKHKHPFSTLGDQAILTRFDCESDAVQFAAAVSAANLPGVVDVVPAYVTVAVYYNLNLTTHAALAHQLECLPIPSASESALSARLHQIPCCYDLGPDLDRVAQHARISTDQVIRFHSDKIYTVYAIGFCPGFPYLGYLPDALCGVPRLPSPRLRVEPGSVGLTGRQTGIYPLERPGGWSLIGRTPLQLVDVASGYFPLRAGDRVQFVPIDRSEFDNRLGERLD
jgi:inhibitor of KinA